MRSVQRYKIFDCAVVTEGSRAIHVAPLPYRGAKTGTDQSTDKAAGSNSHGLGDRGRRVHQRSEHFEACRAKFLIDFLADRGIPGNRDKESHLFPRRQVFYPSAGLAERQAKVVQIYELSVNRARFLGHIARIFREIRAGSN